VETPSFVVLGSELWVALLEQEVGSGDLQRSLPTSTSLNQQNLVARHLRLTPDKAKSCIVLGEDGSCESRGCSDVCGHHAASAKPRLHCVCVSTLQVTLAKWKL